MQEFLNGQLEDCDIYVTLTKFHDDEIDNTLFKSASSNELKPDTAILIHSTEEISIQTIINQLKNEYNTVIVKRLPKKIEADIDNYEEFLRTDLLSFVEKYIPQRIIIGRTINYGENYSSLQNSEEYVKRISSVVNNEELKYWENEAAEGMSLISLINFVISEYKVLMHHIIFDENEIGVENFLFDKSLQCFIRRHVLTIDHSRTNTIIDTSTLAYYATNILTDTKQYDFYFSLIPNGEIEEKFSKDLSKILSTSKKIVFNTNDTIDYHTKSTLLIPNLNNIFDLYKFVKLINLRVLPIIFENDYITPFAGYPVLINFIEENLLIEDISKINEHIKYISDNYENLLEQINSTDFFIELSDLDFQSQQATIFYK